MEAALEDQVNLVNAEILAKERGITIIGEISTDPGDFGTMIQTEVVTERKSYIAAGTLFGSKLPAHDFDLAMFTYLVRVDPIYNIPNFSCGSPSNYAEYCNRSVTKKLEASTRTVNLKKRVALLKQVDKVLAVTEDAYRRSEAGTVPDDQMRAIEAIRSHRLTEALRQQRERRGRRFAEIQSPIPEGGEWGPKDLPDDLAVDWAREQSRDRFLTLTGASILIPPARREDVGTIRVDIRHVGAWWPARFETAQGDEGAEASGG